jgi:hypothetical protein
MLAQAMPMRHAPLNVFFITLPPVAVFHDLSSSFSVDGPQNALAAVNSSLQGNLWRQTRCQRGFFLSGRTGFFLAKRVEGNEGAIQIKKFYGSRGSVKFYSQKKKDRKWGKGMEEGSW